MLIFSTMLMHQRLQRVWSMTRVDANVRGWPDECVGGRNPPPHHQHLAWGIRSGVKKIHRGLWVIVWVGVGLGQTSISAPGIVLCSPLWDDDEDQGVAETSEEVPTWGA